MYQRPWVPSTKFFPKRKCMSPGHSTHTKRLEALFRFPVIHALVCPLWHLHMLTDARQPTVARISTESCSLPWSAGGTLAASAPPEPSLCSDILWIQMEAHSKYLLSFLISLSITFWRLTQVVLGINSHCLCGCTAIACCWPLTRLTVRVISSFWLLGMKPLEASM